MGSSRKSLPLWLKTDFLRNIATLVSGTAIAQVAGLLFIPWITRLYGPEAFGGLGYFSSLLAFLTPLSALCYPLALVLPKRQVEARLLFDLSLKIAVNTSLLAAVVFLIIENLDHELLPFSASYVLVPLGVLLSFGVLAYTQWAIRCGRYRLIAQATILAAIAGGVAKVAVGYFYPNTLSLITVTILVLLFNVTLLANNLTLVVKPVEVLAIRPRHWMIARKYMRFPIFRMPHSLIALISQIAPIFLLTAFYGAKYAGYFVLTRTVLSAPVALVGKAVYDASYPRIAQNHNAGKENLTFLIKLTSGLAGFSLLPLVVIVLAGDSIFLLIFGPEWERAGVYATWMAFWFAFTFSNKAIAAAVSVYGMDSFLFRNGILNLFLSLTGFFIGTIYFSSDIVSVALFSLFGIFCQFLLIAKVFQTVKNSDSKMGPGVGTL